MAGGADVEVQKNVSLALQSHLYGLPSAIFCCSVVIMGLRSCFLRFLPLLVLLPLDVAALTACFALLVTAFLISDPFMVMRYLLRRAGYDTG